MITKTQSKGLQTAPDKRGKIKNCTAGKSYPCGKACLGLGSAILEQCLKKLKPEMGKKAEKLKSQLNKQVENKTKTTKPKPEKSPEAQVADYLKKQKKFQEVIDSAYRNINNLTKRDKTKLLAGAKKLIEERYELLTKYDSEILSDKEPTVPSSENEQHNIIAPSFKQIQKEHIGYLLGYSNKFVFTPSNPNNVDFGDELLSIDLKSDSDTLKKAQVIDAIINETQYNTETRDSITSIAKQASVPEEKAQQMFESVKAFTGSFYSAIRRADKGENAPESFKQHAKNINEFLDKFKPKYKGTIYRGMVIDERTKNQIIEELRNGGFEHLAMSSYSSSEKVADSFSQPYSDKQGIVLVNKSKSGVSVRNISGSAHEEEVLIPKGVKLKMVREPYEKDGKTYIEVEEV